MLRNKTTEPKEDSWVKFNADGYLDAGFHDLDVDAIEEHLVTGFPTSTTRKPILDGYKRHRGDIEALGLTCEQFLDGSFASTKNDPGDIDLVGLMDIDSVDALSIDDRVIFESLFSGQVTKLSHSCDAYYCPTVDESDPRHGRLRTTRKYWMGEFGYDRHDKPKGMIRTTVIPAPPAPVVPGPSAPIVPGSV